MADKKIFIGFGITCPELTKEAKALIGSYKEGYYIEGIVLKKKPGIRKDKALIQFRTKRENNFSDDFAKMIILEYLAQKHSLRVYPKTNNHNNFYVIESTCFNSINSLKFKLKLLDKVNSEFNKAFSKYQDNKIKRILKEAGLSK